VEGWLNDDEGIYSLTDFLVQHTPVHSRKAGAVGVVTDYPLNESRSSYRWHTIIDLCHELMHVLAHPDLPAAADRIQAGQIVQEGFVEVLGLRVLQLAARRGEAVPDERLAQGSLERRKTPPRRSQTTATPATPRRRS